MKRLLIAILVLTFLVSFVAVIGDTNTREHSAELYPPEVWEYTTTASMNAFQQSVVYGTATYANIEIKTERSRYRNMANFDLWVYNMPSLDNYEIYEVWFVDDDTGYKLTGGVFSVDYYGDERHSANFQTYLDVYDRVVVTVEPYPDEDPNPSGDVALVADINLEHLIKRRVSITESVVD